MLLKTMCYEFILDPFKARGANVCGSRALLRALFFWKLALSNDECVVGQLLCSEVFSPGKWLLSQKNLHFLIGFVAD